MRNVAVLFSLILVAASAVSTTAQTGGPFDLKHNVIASGGGKSSGTTATRSFTVEGTIGQGIAGTTSESTPPQFSVRGGFWGFQQLVPTASTVSVSGRVLSAQGRGIAMAQVSLTNSAGETQIATTNVFGFYRFDEVEVGETYIVSASMKRFQFTPQILVVDDEITGLNFVGSPAVIGR